MHHRTLHRALLLGALAAGAWTATELADDHAAHADTPPAVTIDRPGGPADRATQMPHRLPQQASARARQAVAKVTAEPAPSTPAEPTPEPCEDQDDEPEPSTPAEPEPEPSDPPVEDKPAEDKPRNEPTPPVEAPPADEPPVEAPPVEVPAPVELPPLPPVEVPPLPTPPPIPTPVPTPDPTPPVVDAPTPLPTDGGTAPQLPLPVPAPVVVPDPLPVVIGPVPAAEPPAVEPSAMLGQTAAVIDVEVQWCPDEMRTDYAPDDRDMIGHLIASLTDPAETPRATPKPGCPSVPDRDAAPGAVQVKPPTQSAADTAVADVAGSHVAPVLARLEHTRARSHLPAGRSQHIEPSPA